MNSIKKIFMILLLLISSFYMLGCTSKDKLLTLSANVKEGMKIKENSILESMNSGSTALTNKDFAEAKKEFVKAISYDKSNIKTYIDIKDKYLDAKRFDDAYYFIKMALDNNIDLDNMNNILEDIKSNFEIAEINQSVPLNSKYTLPTEVSININGEPSNVRINWKNFDISTTKLGTFVYEGFSVDYGRNIKLNLNVRNIKKEKKFGYIKDLYEKNGDIFIKFDEREFYLDTENSKVATEKAKADGKPLTQDLPYYIRDINSAIKEYKISKDSIYKLCYWVLDPYTSSATTVPVDFNTFKKYVQQRLLPDYGSGNSLIFWINTEEDVIVNLEMQFTP